MDKISLLFFVFLFITSTVSSQAIFELSPSQSMSITGKGPGQDAAENPYSATNSISIIVNIDKNPFTVRVQRKEELVETFVLTEGEKREVKLLNGYQLYLDSDLKAKASVEFKKFKL